MTKQVYVEKKNLFEKIIKRMIGKQVRNNQFTTKFTKRNETLFRRLSLCDYFYKVGEKQWEKNENWIKFQNENPALSKIYVFTICRALSEKILKENITYQ